MSVNVLYKITATANTVVHRRSLIRQINDGGFVAVLLGVQESREPAPDDDLSLTFDVALTGLEKTALDGIVAAHQGVKTTSEYRAYESNPAQTNATTEFSTAVTETTPALREGAYIFTWQCQMELIEVGGSINSRGIVQFQVDGNTENTSSWNQDAPHTLSGSARVIAREGDTYVIRLRYRRDPDLGGDDTVQVSKLKMNYERKA